MGAITIVLWSQHSTDEAVIPTQAVIKEPLGSGPNSPLGKPYPNPPIKIDDGALWPATKNPVTQTPDLVAVDGQDTVMLSSSPKPVSDGIVIDSLPDEQPTGVVQLLQSSSSASSSDPESSSSDRDYYGRTYVSSSFPYYGFYMRGGVGDPPRRRNPSSAEPEMSETSGDSDQEGSAEGIIKETNDSPDIIDESSESSLFLSSYF